MIKKINYFYDISNSPWPILIRICGINLFFRFMLFFKFKLLIVFWNLFVLVLGSFSWWKDYSLELNIFGFSRIIIEDLLKGSMLLFILSEFMLFFSLFWTYYNFFLGPCADIGMSFPPSFVRSFDWLIMPSVNTFILVFSSITVTISHYNIFVKGRMLIFFIFLILTIFLGCIFRFCQFLEYRDSFFDITDSIYGSIFFLLTGLHGSHVLLGRVFLLVSIFRFFNVNVRENRFLGFELASWYWHFVDLVWIFVFYSLYYLIR